MTWQTVIPDSEEIKFEVYTNYLWGLSYYLDKKYPQLKDQIVEIDISKLALNPTYDCKELQKFFNNSWNSERLLNTPLELNSGDYFIKYANHWSPVLSYYSIFLCFQALFISLGWKPILEHRSFLAKLSSLINKGKLPFIYPWDHLCWGCCGQKQEEFNFTVDCNEISKFSSLSNPAFSEDEVLFGKILKTTRHKLETYYEEKWKREGKIKNKNGGPRKAYKKTDKIAVSDSIAKTSLLDFLYRLRIRSNYEDADIFFLGDRNDVTIKNYFNSLISITTQLLFFTETMVRHTVGKQAFLDCIGVFEKASGGYSGGIIARKDIHSAY
jgi:hypothetical protein